MVTATNLHAHTIFTTQLSYLHIAQIAVRQVVYRSKDITKGCVKDIATNFGKVNLVTFALYIRSNSFRGETTHVGDLVRFVNLGAAYCNQLTGIP